MDMGSNRTSACVDLSAPVSVGGLFDAAAGAMQAQSLCLHRSPETDAQCDNFNSGEQPPGLDIRLDQPVCHCNGYRNRCGNSPVITNDKVIPKFEKCPDVAHVVLLDSVRC